MVAGLEYHGETLGSEIPASRTLAPRSRDASSVLPASAAVAHLFGVTLAVVWIAFDGGSFGTGQRTAIAIALWWAVLVGALSGLWPRQRPPQSALVVGGFILAFAAYAGASAAWAPDAEQPLLELGRGLLYLGVFALIVVASGRGTAGRWADGLAIGISAVGAVALASRLFAGNFGQDEMVAFLPEAGTRLAYPVNYWNGLAILLALGIPLLLRAAVTARSEWVRGLALALMPMLAVTIYLTSSRTGVAASAIGIVAFVALSDARWRAAGATAVSVLASLAATLFVARQTELVDGPLRSGEAASQGRLSALVILALGGTAALVYALASRQLGGVRLPRAIGWVAAGAIVAFAAAVVAAADPVARWHEFTRPPAEVTSSVSINRHLLSASGNWRWQLWHASLEQVARRPLTGEGVGSYRVSWLQRDSAVGFVDNPHSAYFQTLGELGIVGLLLLLGGLGTGAVVAVRRALRAPPESRATGAALAASILAFLAGLGVDWMWELTAVTVIGFTLIALGVGPASQPTAPPPTQLRGPRVRLVRFAIGVLAALVLVLQTDLFLANDQVRASQAQAARLELDGAARSANRARLLAPWMTSPYLQLALVAEQRGRLDEAANRITSALAQNREDWRIWLVGARIDVAAGKIEQARAKLAEARRLNPRSQVLTTSAR